MHKIRPILHICVFVLFSIVITACGSGSESNNGGDSDTIAPSTEAQPPGGNYNSAQTVALTANETSTIYYTLDGTTPSTSSTAYSSIISIDATSTLKFFGVDLEGNAESVKTQIYTIGSLSSDTTPPTTTASLAGGDYSGPQTVELFATENSTIYYTLDGSTPTTSSTAYVSAISIDSTTTLKFFGVDLVGNVESVNTQNYSITTTPTDTIAPITTANPSGGSYSGGLTVTLSPNESAITLYTTDGSIPSISSDQYSSPIAITSTITLRFLSVDTAGNAESAKLQTYTIDDVVPSTTANPQGGTYGTAQSVTLSVSEVATIYYTTDGSTPNTSSNIYSGAVNVSSTTTLNYFAVDTVGNAETVQTQTYTIDSGLPTTTASPPGGIYNTSQSVTLLADKVATIYFTTDGSIPTTASPVYNTAIPVNATTTIRFFADDGLGNTESVKSQTYTIDTISPTTTTSLAEGSYNSALEVTLSADEAGTTYYTVDGSSPDTASQTYSSPINIVATTTLKFFTADTAGNAETVKSRIYSIDTSSPTTTASPVGGIYGSAQNVALTADEVVTIYYSTDGSTLNISSNVYSSEINISSSTTLKYFAVDTAGNAEAVKTQTYTIDSDLPTTTASPPGGTYASAQNVALSSDEAATIYYTTNGVDPTTGSATYSSAINIAADTTLKFFAVDTAGNAESIKTETYTIDTTAPTTTASPAGGTYSTAQNVVLSVDEAATIFYTTDGSTPNTSSNVYSGAINVSSTTTLNYFAEDTVGNAEAVKTQIFTIDSDLPTTTASPFGGSYNTAQSVTLTADKVATIYFTTDGSTPTTASAVYNTAIPVSVTTTIRFFADDGFGNIESVKNQSYTIDTNSPTTTASPVGGTYGSAQNVTLSADEAATIYYTTNGADPTLGSASYSSAINIAADTTLKFFAVDTAGNAESIKTETYTIDTTAPTTTASPAGATYGSAQNVSLSSDEAATIYYTTNGVDPTTGSATYSSAINIDADTTLKFFAIDTLGNEESINTETYIIDTTAPTTTASPAGGTYGSAQNITLSSDEATTIYYTTNGADPTTGSAIYSSAINIAAATTLKFLAVDSAGNAESVNTENYVIDTTAPTTTASPAGGTYGSAQNVILSTDEAATIYYTTNGVDPTTGSPAYSSAINISSDTTLKFFAVDSLGNTELINTKTYLFDTIAPTTTAAPVGGTYTNAQNVTLITNESATIYYTTDGSAPFSGSAIYSSSLNIGTTTTLKYFAVDGVGNTELVKESNYTINLGSVTAITLNDTGLDYGGNYSSGNNADCSGETIGQQDCSHGRDATHKNYNDGHAGFSFTKLDINGNDLAASAVDWVCVRDNVTGLVWEIKTDDGGIHDKDNTYRWGGSSALLNSSFGIVFDDWDTLVNGSNSENAGNGLCGFTDWRVPSREELRSIVSYDRYLNPDATVAAIDQDYFPIDAFPQPGFGEPDLNWFWTASPSAHGDIYAWKMYYTSGEGQSYGRSEANHVRLVRGD